MVYIACWGGATCLFLQYLLQAYTVFNKKDSKIYRLIIAGLLMCYLQSSLTMIVVIIDFVYPNMKLSLIVWYSIFIPLTLAWFFMVQINQWMYVYRIKSLGTYSRVDKYMNYVPFFVAFIQLPNFIINLARLNIEDVDDKKYHYFIISSSIFSICISFVEICMFFILLRKLNFILEYKPDVLAKMGHHLKVTCVLVILLEVVMAVVRFEFLVDFSISPLIYLLKIYIIIQFYNDLLANINKQIIIDQTSIHSVVHLVIGDASQ